MVSVIYYPCDTILRCKETEKLFHRQQSRRFGNIEAVARRKLRMLDDAEKLEDMAAVPGNRLEALGGNRKGQHSIRINDQWRICLLWRAGEAERVEIVDYH
jgi:toxin HigB-1